MLWFAIDSLLYVSGLLALQALGWPLPVCLGVMASLYFITSKLFRLVGVAGGAWLLLSMG